MPRTLTPRACASFQDGTLDNFCKEYGTLEQRPSEHTVQPSPACVDGERAGRSLLWPICPRAAVVRPRGPEQDTAPRARTIG